MLASGLVGTGAAPGRRVRRKGAGLLLGTTTVAEASAIAGTRSLDGGLASPVAPTTTTGISVLGLMADGTAAETASIVLGRNVFVNESNI